MLRIAFQRMPSSIACKSTPVKRRITSGPHRLPTNRSKKLFALLKCCFHLQALFYVFAHYQGACLPRYGVQRAHRDVNRRRRRRAYRVSL